MTNNAPSLLYFFEHMFLRDAVFKNSDFLNGILENPGTLSQGLISNFNRIKSNPDNGLVDKDFDLKADDFSSEMITLENGSKMALIKCPTPHKPPEAGFIGIVLGPSPSYFVSEYETYDAESAPKYIFCEWEQGKHLNYGEISNTKEDFVKRVSEILSKS